MLITLLMLHSVSRCRSTGTIAALLPVVGWYASLQDGAEHMRRLVIPCSCLSRLTQCSQRHTTLLQLDHQLLLVYNLSCLVHLHLHLHEVIVIDDLFGTRWLRMLDVIEHHTSIHAQLVCMLLACTCK